jgi:4-amino-4-deoxy-L-arabinose transferase-like glycosyltransferase
MEKCRNIITLNIFILILSLSLVSLVSIEKGPFLGFMWDELTYIAGAINISNGLGYTLDRPPFLSACISLIFSIWGINLSLIKYLSPFFGLGSILIIYCLALVFYGKREAFLSALLVSSLPLHFFLATRLLTEIPFLIFFSASLLFIYLATVKNEKYLLCLGLTIALTILTRYTGLVLIGIFFLYLFLIRKLGIIFSRYFLYGGIVFVLVLSPWLLNNIYFLNSFFAPLIDNFEINRNITTVEAITLPLINSRISSRSYYYLWAILLTSSILLPFSIMGIWKSKPLRRQDILLILSIGAILLPHLFMVGRYSVRFLIGLVPPVTIFSARFFSYLLDRYGDKYRLNQFVCLIWSINLLLGSSAVIWYANNRQMQENPQYHLYQGIYKYIKTLRLPEVRIITNLEPVVIYSGHKPISVAYNEDSFYQQLAHADYVLISKREPNWIKLSFIKQVEGLQKISLPALNGMDNIILFYRIIKPS